MTYKVTEGDDWVLYRSPAVEHESEEMIAQLGRSYRQFKQTFTGFDSSLTSRELTVGSLPDIFNVEEQHEKDKEFLNNMSEGFSGYRFYNPVSYTHLTLPTKRIV